MSFFYGMNETSATTNSSYTDPFAKTILPGHNFKNPYMTITIAIVVLTMISMPALSWIGHRAPKIYEPREPGDKTRYGGKKHPSGGLGGICFWYILYLIFELIIRICVELRLTVPYAFIALEIPSRFFLMVADVILLWCLFENSGIIRDRLGIKNDALTYLSKPFFFIGGTGIILVFFGERIAYIVMMVKQGFRWGRPDPMYYAISRTVYTGAYLLLTLLLWVRFIRMWIVYRKRASSGTFTDRCQKIPFVFFAVIGPMITIRGASAFCFVFFFRMMKKRQNPNLELLRMALLCLPLLVILYGFIWIRKVDYSVKEKEAQREYASQINLLHMGYKHGP
ncbi:hypothetical protein BCR34DRAFT_584380 [Clohesyomyces aquaticus]|uniref:Uncharacterized protein n=1 Tax=Clohesyomyces aquaticus TaxID=1231657 RepID=A0A1Y2A1V3_9PLEO|nr:hypothetical protein BCR34DRAFT_584380 [Clohesyomyces aquaticus]